MNNIASLVLQASATVGLGDFTLTSVVGWRTFNAAFGTGTGNKFYYVIRNKDVSNEYEIGISYLVSATELKRNGSQQVLASSNNNNSVNFSAGSKEIVCSLPAPLFAAPQLPLAIPTNRYIHPAGVSGPPSNGLLTVGKAYAVPFIVPTYTEFNRIGVRCITAIASSSVRLGIYSHDVLSGPKSLILDANTIETTTTGDKEISTSALLGAGPYWLVVQHNAGASAIGINWRECNALFLGTTNSNDSTGLPQMTNAGSLPATFIPDTYLDSSFVPDIWLRKV